MDGGNASIKSAVADGTMVPVKKHFGYFISYTKYLRDMHTKLRELNDVRMAVEEHVNHNRLSRLEVSAQVKGWLEEVEHISEQVQKIRTDVNSSFNLKMRHMVGRKAFKIIQEIESLLRQQSMMTWINDPVPLGKVDFTKASTSTSSSDHNEFQSRDQTFREALKALEPDHISNMTALWGMGGVGKTTMVQNLKKVVKERKMFDYIVEVVIGEKTDPIAIQDSVADYVSIELKEKTISARADKLRQRFKVISRGGKCKILLILDDVWEPVYLEDIGLSNFPNQGVDFKVLLTSRIRDVCYRMGVQASSILKVNVLTEAEAQSLFHRYVETSDDVDPELIKIGEDIVRKCCGLPIAIKTMAYALRNKSMDAWKDALARLEHHDTHNVVGQVLKRSYDHIENQETRSIFLLCGLFPENFDIPTEDLVRYGWGLKIFTMVFTMRDARYRLETCIEKLIYDNLLIRSDSVGCIMMHNLVRAFVLGMFSEVEHASVVNDGNMPGWPADDMGNSCKRISLTCKDMSKFPRDLKFPNLSILKLMDGDESLRFPEDFYGEMENLQVISYDNIKHPLLPPSLQCSNVRVLHLHHCSLMFDCSSIGNLLNLEVLSVANSAIELFPSTIGNLKKLRLLDLTNCVGLRIGNGVFRNLVKLEELYMRVDDRDSFFVRAENRKAISFMDDNYSELEERLENVSALEFEFFQNTAQPKNISFEKLIRFKISMGRSLKGVFKKSEHSFENTLKLVTNKGELLESRMNELFEKTELLCLSVDDMNDLGDIDVKSLHPPRFCSFYNVRVLVISDCTKLRYLFTLGVAKGFRNLKHLEVYSCDKMEELIHSESGGEETITFPMLRSLSLIFLPNLLDLCHDVNIVELPQLMELGLAGIPNFTNIYPNKKLETSCLLKEEVVMPKLEKLHICHMENLKEIWPCEFIMSEKVNVSLLRAIEVTDCDNLVNLFPCNPLPLLDNLEELQLRKCGSIEVLFNIDLDSVGGIGEGSSKSRLRSIEVNQLGKLRELWRIRGANNSGLLIDGFQAVEYIEITKCMKFRNVFTPTTTKFDLGTRMEIWINHSADGRNNELVESIQEQEINVISDEQTSEVGDCISNVAFPSYLIHSFYNLCKLKLWNYEGVEVVFDIGSPKSRELVTTPGNQQRLLPYLEELDIRHMDNMSHVWKCNWNTFLILKKQQLESSFHSLTTIHVSTCRSIKYLFSPLMAKLLSNLKNVKIAICDDVEAVVSNRDDEDEEKTRSIYKSTTLFPHLSILTLACLRNLKCIGGGGGANRRSNVLSSGNTTTETIFLDQSKVDGGCWSLCQYPREISIVDCDALSSVIPFYAVGQMQKLQVLKIESCKSLKEVFETHIGSGGCTSFDEGNGCTPRLNNGIILQLPKLKILEIKDCDLVEHLFTFSALESLVQLQEVLLENCMDMEVIVKEEQGEKTTTSNAVVFPCLKSIALVNLPNLAGFFLGKNEFSWPLLDKVTIRDCPKMTVFTRGRSTAPKLKHMQTSLGNNINECDLNFHQTPLLSSGNTSSSPETLEGIPSSFHNVTNLRLDNNGSTKIIIQSSVLRQLQMLEEIHVWSCDLVEEVFGALEGESSSFDESKTVVKLPNLTKVELVFLQNLKYIWKSNQWTKFEVPKLTRVSISHCHTLKHVFTSSMVSSLLKLQELHISCCNNMEVVLMDENVVEEEIKSLGKLNQMTLPHLKSLILDELPSLKGFCLGKKDFCFPLLDTLRIERCGAIMIFTKGNSATPELKETESSLGSSYEGEAINYFTKIKQEEFKGDNQ